MKVEFVSRTYNDTHKGIIKLCEHITIIGVTADDETKSCPEYVDCYSIKCEVCNVIHNIQSNIN